MQNKYLTENNYEEETGEEYWEYSLRQAESAKKEIALLDEILEKKYAIELELYNHQ